MIDFDFAALRRIGLNNPIAARLAAHDRGLPARVASVHRTSLILHDGLYEFPARLRPSPGAAPAVGDWAPFDRNDQGEAWVHALVDPLNELARRDAGGTRQRLAANVDTALLVMGLDGDFNLRRLERYLMVARSSDVAPVIVLTKGDLVHDDRLRDYHKLLREVRHATATPLDRIAARSKWKVLNRMARARAQAKR